MVGEVVTVGLYMVRMATIALYGTLVISDTHHTIAKYIIYTHRQQTTCTSTSENEKA